MKKKAVVLTLLLTLSVFANFFNTFAEYNPPFEISAKAALLVNLDTNEVLYSKNPDEKLYPASLTKIMTAILLMENVKDLDAETATAKDYIYEEFVGLDISTADIRHGETLTMNQLLHCMLIQSANEAASIVADKLGNGSIPKFVEMMNAKAQEIGAVNTHFTNPHGLFDPEQYTTAEDLRKITQYALNIPGFSDVVKQTRYGIAETNKHEARTLVTTNLMMDEVNGGMYYDSRVEGVKTGSLPESGKNLITTATSGDYRYLLIILGEPIDDMLHFTDTSKLYDWAFESFEDKELLSTEKSVAQVKLELSWEKDQLLLYPERGFEALVPNEIDASSVQPVPVIPESVKAPIKKGERIGYINLMLSGEQIGQVPLVSQEDIGRNFLLSAMDAATDIVRSFWFKFIVIFLVVLLIEYIAVTIWKNQSRKQRYHKMTKR
ncbi:D-alanyl-D-alanine carboxypeptidase family protein [Candidatus Soleaferrea massiliensis]|uniref:D-alanyl-D-alanine carboxypeptidase family protein n=1 Tax=Candidatus Soleaferrea massiliensis TaxID=1470354 RepID=UPI00058C1422|nr:D-alanyl-D-alanine carboxypeptidase family protein [Candidatus Soleaferrea massiliensis]